MGERRATKGLVTVSTDSTSPTITPGEILERLRQRITELEAQLAEAQDQNQGQDHRRLQDLSPDELSLEALGAAGEIIKAARQQATDMRQAVAAETSKAREAAKQTLAQAATQADQIRADAEATRDSMMLETRESTDKILTRVRQEADDITAKAAAESEETRRSAQAEADSLVSDAQRRLQSSLLASEQATQNARDEARQIVEAARSMADSLREDARAEARSVIAEALSQLSQQEDTMADLLNQAVSLRSSVGTVLDAVRTSAEAVAAETARAEATTHSYLAAIAQLKADLQARIGPLQPRD